MDFSPETFEYETLIFNHEFYPTENWVRIGIWNGQYVAFKSGRYLENEITIMKQIGHHPNIVRFIKEIDGCLLMEGVKHGLTLNDYCRNTRQVPFEIRTCITLLGQLASALKHLHDLGIIHHDLHDKNILVDLTNEKSPILKLCDFGISEIVDENGRGKEENGGYGTYHAMAPEQKSNGIITTKIDVYAFGYIVSIITQKGRSMYDIPMKFQKLITCCQQNNSNDRINMDDVLDFLDNSDLINAPTYKDDIIRMYNMCKEKNISPPADLEKLYNTVTTIEKVN